MILGMSTQTFLAVHVTISLIGIATGLVAIVAAARDRHLSAWVAAFLATTLLTSLTGFPLPPFGIDPPRIVGILTLGLVLLAGAGLYLFNAAGGWRVIYILSSTAALYLNVFVGITQSFQKIAPLHVLAPMQTEPPFLAAHFVSLAAFGYLGFLAFRHFGGTNATATPAGMNRPA